MTSDRVVDLGAQRPERIPRQEIPFNADGALIGPRIPQGRWPLIVGGDIYQCVNTLVFPSPLPITVTAIRFRRATPADASLLGTYIIPAGLYYYEHDCEWDIGVGDQVAFGLGMEEPTEDMIPGSGLFILALVS